jgi:hypothetical protein
MDYLPFLLCKKGVTAYNEQCFFFPLLSMYFTHDGGDDEEDTSIVSPDPDAPGPESGDYTHPQGDVPGDPTVDNSQLG